jgi:predicted dehydrogenase
MTRVGLVGCGSVGGKRARVLQGPCGDSRLVAVADVARARAEALAAQHAGCEVERDGEALVARSDVDLVIVATTHDALATLTRRALEHGKHVLVEKPAARAPAELEGLGEAARAAGVVVKVGFNHRFHPALRRAKELFDDGAVGALMYVRARYGHGGRLGYEREWRARPELSGGGELIDQGVHLVDLARWFAGDFVEAAGHVGTFFWNMPVEDNGFLLLRTATGAVAWLHASCTEWKNLFSFEVFGRDGKLQVDGLGGSYGVERLTFHRMKPEMGPPETQSWDYPGEDLSWRDEYAHLVECIAHGRAPEGTLEDARAALEVVARAYALPGRRTRPVAPRRR